jgi:hypothetical protein
MHIRTGLLLLMICLAAGAVNAQNSTNFLSVTPYNPITKTFTTTTEIETDQSFAYAYIVQTTAKTTNCRVYAKISSYTGPAGYVPSSYPISLHYVGTNSSTASNINTTFLQLTGTDQMLFQETKHNSQNSFYYDGIFKATNYALKAGSYTYTLTFTMTQP